jgi:general secretion pathway protein D
MTLNNETAEIEIKTDEAIGVLATTTSTEGVGESVSQAERVETGVFLKVTPQANLQTGEITMAVEPKVIQARLGQPFGGSAFKDPEERGTKSLLRVRDGDTIILGGLLRTDRTKTETKVPIISSIPILGAAFRHKDETNSERELIVFITPHIIRDDYPTTQLSANNQDQFLREQHVPRSRLQKIDKELSYLENQRF